MLVGISINDTMKCDALEDPGRVGKFLFALYKIAYEVTNCYFRFVERKICMRQVVDSRDL